MLSSGVAVTSQIFFQMLKETPRVSPGWLCHVLSVPVIPCRLPCLLLLVQNYHISYFLRETFILRNIVVGSFHANSNLKMESSLPQSLNCHSLHIWLAPFLLLRNELIAELPTSTCALFRNILNENKIFILYTIYLFSKNHYRKFQTC